MTTKAGVSESLEFPLIGSALGGHGAVSVCFRSQCSYPGSSKKKSALHFYQKDYAAQLVEPLLSMQKALGPISIIKSGSAHL